MSVATHEASHGVSDTWGWKSMILEGLIAYIMLLGSIVNFVLGGSEVITGFALLIGAVLAMNSLAKGELVAKLLPVKYIREHKVMQVFYHITDEGELAGIFVACIAAGLLIGSGKPVHIAYVEAFTLLGIMSAANIAVMHLIPVMSFLERLGGPWLVVTGGSLLSSLTGEPAASVFLGQYLKDRCSDEDRAKLATRLAATIGSGGGLTPFAAPPILIIWGTLASVFHWTIGHLLMFVGLGCIAHVALTALTVGHLMRTKQTDPKTERLSIHAIVPLALLAGIVALHILVMLGLIPGVPVFVADAIIGLYSWWSARRKYAGRPELREERFTAMWQPLILAVLLIGLEIIGEVADPAIFWLAAFIPETMPPLAIGIVIFFATAWSSHIADNALATRVFISVAVSLLAIHGVDVGNFLAACVVMGGLFGGFLLIPANLPNFYLARVFNVSPGGWVKVAWKLYPTGIAYMGWIFVLYYWVI